MRQSLSISRPTRSRPAAWAALSSLVLSAVLAAAAVVDQAGGHSLSQHAAAVYAPYGKDADPNLLYGVVYTVAAVGLVLWLVVLRAVRSHRPSAALQAAVVAAITAALAVLLLATTEYGAQIFPPVWGVLALLPSAAGVVTAVLLLHRRHGTRPAFGAG